MPWFETSSGVPTHEYGDDTWRTLRISTGLHLQHWYKRFSGMRSKSTCRSKVRKAEETAISDKFREVVDSLDDNKKTRCLARAEILRCMYDREVVFDRKKLVKRLVQANNASTGYKALPIYLLVFCMIIWLASMEMNSSTAYPLGGFLKDQIVYKSFGNGREGMFDVKSPADFWDFLRTGVLSDWTAINSDDEVLPFLNTQQSTGSVTVSQRRDERTECKPYYTLPTFLEGDCPTGSSVSNLADYGNATGVDFFHEFSFREDGRYFPDHARMIAFASASNRTCPLYRALVGEADRWSFVYGDSHTANMVLDVFDPTFSVPNLLEECKWIDQYTREVSMEVYTMTRIGTQETYIGSLWLTFKFQTDNAVVPSFLIFTVRVKRTDINQLWGVYWTCVALVAIALVLWVVSHTQILCTVGFTYIRLFFGDFWNDFDLIWFGLNIAYFSLVHETVTLTNRLSDEEFNTLLVAELMEGNSILQLVRAFLLFFYTIRILKFIRHRGLLSIVWKTLEAVWVQIFHFAITLSIVLLSLAALGHQSFGYILSSYSTFPKALMSITRMMFGDFQFSSLDSLNSGLARFLFVMTVFVLAVILLNFFVALVLDGYSVLANERRYKLTVWDEALWAAINIADAFGERHSIMKVIQTLSRRSQLGMKRRVSLYDIRRHMGKKDLPHEVLLTMADMTEGEHLNLLFAGPYSGKNVLPCRADFPCAQLYFGLRRLMKWISRPNLFINLVERKIRELLRLPVENAQEENRRLKKAVAEAVKRANMVSADAERRRSALGKAHEGDSAKSDEKLTEDVVRTESPEALPPKSGGGRSSLVTSEEAMYIRDLESRLDYLLSKLEKSAGAKHIKSE